MSKEEQPKTLETSTLFEPYLMWILVVLLLIAIGYRFIPLVIVSTFLLLLSSIITIWKKMSLMHIKPTLQLSKTRLFVDEEFLIHASIYNDKWLPLIWLEWSFPKDEGIRLGDKEDDTHTIRFLWLLWFQQVKCTLKGRGLKRGVYNIGEVILRSGDGFRFAETEELFSLDNRLYVYPKRVAVHVPNFSASIQWGVKGKQGGFIEDPLLVMGIREYQAGDELRRLNWRASSRTGKLQANVYQPVVMEQLMMYIDVQGFVINESAYENPTELKTYVSNKREAFEEFLSIIASIAVKYREQGISIGFVSNALNNDREKMPSILPSTNLTPHLDQLAEITQTVGVEKMRALDEMLHRGQLYAPLYIFCNHITEGHYMWYQQHKNKLTEVCFYYRNETEYAKKLATVAKSINRFLSS
ncbi:hypothetical protein CACET_c25390 [Clostridium aceticum]|uniref:Uncharacterized protein n=1 Tax=Clostridium aceticum TaxID=84022 RepID=A0A0D8ICZ7_9CLOT|nr:DUF58 domain-containing protein [Clostridium aceticum]AKL95984.1 hypothetical protein CACET_c25390 [Clostridium aceticum]KJF27071.1 hypothetical protein TZ02_09735 [Clostridium aceticum]